MLKKRTKSVKQLMAKQITDNEKIILSGISLKYSIDNVDKGNFVLIERISGWLGFEHCQIQRLHAWWQNSSTVRGQLGRASVYAPT